MTLLLLALAPLLSTAVAESRLHVALPHAPPTLDPAAATTGSAWLVVDQVYETLFRVTPSGEVVGRLAAEWTYASSTRLRVRLVPGVTFSDGAALGAAAVQASLARLKGPAGTAQAHRLLESVVDVEVQDATTVVIVTSEPFAPLPALLAHPATAIVPGGFGRDLDRHPVGSGPYELVEWAESGHLLLRSNPIYRGPAPAITELRFEVVDDPALAAERLAAGQLDLAYFLRQALPPGLEGHPGLAARTLVAPAAVLLGVNSAHPALAELDVRQALALAIDKRSLVDAVLPGGAAPAVAALPPSVRLVPAPLEEPYPYEPEAARALLEDAGLQGRSFTLALREDPELEAVARALQAMLAQVGLELEIQVMSAARFEAQRESSGLELFLTRWESTSLDPDQTLFRGLHSSSIPQGNASRYRVAAVDALLAEARSSTSEVVRRADYLDVLETVLTDLPVIPLYYPLHQVVKGEVLRGELVGPAWYLLDLRGASLAR